MKQSVEQAGLVLLAVNKTGRLYRDEKMLIFLCIAVVCHLLSW